MEKNTFFLINNLSVAVLDKPVLYDIDLNVQSGSIHAIMGPNGSGKSTLAYTLMGHSRYRVLSGSIVLNGINITEVAVHERSRNGLFLSLQYPCEIPGVSVASFLKETYMAIFGITISSLDFQDLLHKRCDQLKIDISFTKRGLNEGFSGGEKKRFELLQLLLLQPKVAILDEIDSGLDVDSLKIVADGIMLARKENPALSLLIITHYQRILDYVIPDYVHVLSAGRIVASGGPAVAHMVESKGYDVFKKDIV